jgi:O-succinylbenzoic acid--CoA ligase
LNPLWTYPGIRLNGRFIPREELEGYQPENAFEREIIDYCVSLFDESEFTQIQSSGSTGPKKNLTFNKCALIQSAEATNSFFGLDKSAQALLALPIAYVAGKMMIVRAIVGQYKLISVAPDSNPIKTLETPVDFVPLTPYQLERCLNESSEKLDLVKTILLGGAPVSSSLRAKVVGIKPHCYQGFGMAETLTHVAVRNLKVEHSPYRKLPDVSLNADHRGCLIVNRPGITSGPLHTNDLVDLNADGFYWQGRADNLINSGGIKIIPEEVEILFFPHIQSNFFIGAIPDERLGEIVALFVEGNQEVELEKVTFDDKYKKPKRVIHMPSFLYTESGKIKRQETIEKALSSAG